MVTSGLASRFAIMAITDVFDKAKSRKSYKYSALPDAGEHEGAKAEAVAWKDGERKRSLKKLAVVGFLIAAALFFVIGYLRTGSAHSCDSAKNGFQCAPEISHSWGQYSPYYSVPSAASRSTPKDCRVTFAQVLSRHGARDPTASKTVLYSAIIQRIHDNVRDYGKHYEFIKNYQYTLGADELSLFGQRQMVNSGIKFYKRYRHLTREHSPYVRSAGQNRVVESALNWTQGFHETRRADSQAHAPDAYPYRVLVIPEDAGVNNTLSHGNCKAFEDGPASEVGSEAQRTWLDIFAPPIAEKLNRNLPGANLTLPDVVYFMDLCPFNTVADPNGRLSPFCDLFTRDEWHSYDYFQSLGKWYGYGNGNPLGPSQGVGFVNELVARLTGRPVVDETTTNSTLDGSDKTFPLGKTLYADFSHDNDMVGVMAALGLYNATEPLSNTTKASPKDTNGYAASWTVPFAARMYVEKMQCEGSDDELVRVLVNDRVVPLQDCGADVLGRCELSKFVDSLSFARAGGHWEQCFA